jgi:hypothetical protein
MVAELLAVNVSVLVDVVLAELNEAVTPLGNPEADKLTALVNPFCGETVITLVPFEPWRIVSEDGEADSMKFGVVDALTVRLTVMVCVSVPDVPEMVTVEVPVAAELRAVSVSVLVPAVLAGLKEAVTPLGNPEADKLTVPVKPFCGLTVIVLENIPCKASLRT